MLFFLLAPTFAKTVSFFLYEFEYAVREGGCISRSGTAAGARAGGPGPWRPKVISGPFAFRKSRHEWLIAYGQHATRL